MKKLTKGIQILYGFGVGYAVIDQIFAQWVLYYYLPPANSGLKPIMGTAFISIALVISRFVDMVMDPLVGYWSDSYDSKWGKRIPFILFGGLPLGLATIAFFYPARSSEIMTFIYLAIIGSLFFTFYTFVGGPYNALIPEIGHTKEERLNLSTWQSVFRLLYTAIAMVLPGILIASLGRGDTELGIRKMVILLTICALVGTYAMAFGLKEKEYSQPHKEPAKFKDSLKLAFKDKDFIYYLVGFLFFFIGFNILRASMNYYVEDLMGMGKKEITIASACLFGASAICFYPVNLLAKKFGYKKIMIINLILLAVFSLLMFFVGKIFPVEAGFVIFTLMGIPIAGAAFIFPPAMLSEIVVMNSQKHNIKLEGIYFGIQGFFLKMSFLISIAVLPVVLVAFKLQVNKVTKGGVYLTCIFSAFFFVTSAYFYSMYNEKRNS